MTESSSDAGNSRDRSNSDAFYGDSVARPRRVLDADFQSTSPDELLGRASIDDYFLGEDDEDDDFYYSEYDELDDDDFDEEFDELYETLPDDEFEEMIDGEGEDDEEETEPETPCETADAAPQEDEFGAFDDFNADEDAFDDSDDDI